MTSNKKKYIEEAEQNVINQAKFWTEFITFIDSMHYGINERLDSYKAREKFAEAFQALRIGAWEEQQFALARCLALVGVGGKEAEEFSKKQAQRVFGKGYSIIYWLDEWNNVPSSWRIADEEAFREELEVRLKGTKDE